MTSTDQTSEFRKILPLVFPKGVLNARDKVDLGRKFCKGATATRDLVGLVTKIPSVIDTACTMSKMLCILELPFVLVQFLNGIFTLFTPHTVAVRVKAVEVSLKKGCCLTKTAAYTCKFLSLLKVIGQSALTWIPVLDVVSFSISLFTFGFASRALLQVRRIQTATRTAQASLRTNPSAPEKVQILKTALTAIKKVEYTCLKGQLFISKRSIQKIDSLLARLTVSTEGVDKLIAKGQVYIEKLSNRVSENLPFAVAKLALKIANIVATGLLFLFAHHPCRNYRPFRLRICQHCPLGSKDILCE